MEIGNPKRLEQPDGAPVRSMSPNVVEAGLKRFADLVVAISGLIFLAPILAAVGLAIRIRMGPPVIFRQLRPGLHGSVFWMYKFRTMIDDAEQSRVPGEDDLRLTQLGRWLRSTSLDELPELVNVARGDMSLVGPRPLLVEYLPLYNPQQARRHEVRPGMTGLAQVRGRNSLSWEERFEYDVWYVDHRSLRLDLSILADTVWTVLARRGISHPNQATMSRFSGSAGRLGEES